jgi:hypothetical protein
MKVIRSFVDGLQHMGFFGIFEARLDFGPAIPLF